MPKQNNQGTVGRNNPRRGENSRKAQAAGKTGRKGEDDRTESAIRVSRIHKGRGTR